MRAVPRYNFGRVPRTRELREAAQRGSAEAQLSLAVTYLETDYTEAARWLELAAGQGSAVGQHLLGQLHASGRGVDRDDGEAVRWFAKAAEQKYAPAQHSLASMYSSGRGVPEDPEEAVRWLRRAAEQGYAPAQFDLGQALAEGDGVASDTAEAVRWIQTAAEHGHAEAQLWLGEAHARGRSVTRDDAVATRWVRKAAQQGLAAAQYWLGMALAEGQRLAKDDEEAVRWTRQAAEKDYPEAQLWLSQAYREGRGVPRDPAEAERWLHRANAAFAQRKESVEPARFLRLREHWPLLVAVIKHRCEWTSGTRVGASSASTPSLTHYAIRVGEACLASAAKDHLRECGLVLADDDEEYAIDLPDGQPSYARPLWRFEPEAEVSRDGTMVTVHFGEVHGPLAGVGKVYTVRETDGRWMVICEHVEWVS